MLIEIEALLNSVLSCNLYSKVVERGIRVAFFGRPNVGKSTLFNSLLGYDRSIVSSVSGTTRDIIEASLEISGYSIKLIDTAGYRETSDQIETLGINKTKREINEADILVCLGENKEDLSLFSGLMVDKKIITVLSKCDINKCTGYDLAVSSKDGLGFEKLLTELSTKIIETTSSKSINSEYYINDRQYKVLAKTLNNVEYVKKQLDGSVALDIISEVVKKIVHNVDEVVNPIGREEIIDNIFSSFCVGK